MSLDRSRWNVQYMQRVLATDPIVYWMQDEKQGLVSYDMVTARSDGARNGAYTGPTLGQPGIGDGRTSAQFDGAADYNDIQTASLAAAFNGAQGSLMIWIRVANAGVWTDGSNDDYLRLEVDINNRIIMRKTNANNTLLMFRIAGAVTDQIVSVALGGRTDFISSILTWDTAADQLIWYTDGTQEGAIQVGLGVWAGALALSIIGAASLAPANVWNGWLAHGAIWDRALSPAEALSVGVL